MTTVIFYTIIFALIFFVAQKGERKGEKKLIVYAYAILYLLTILRYDVGNDYEGYYNAINDVVKMFDKSYSNLSDMWIEYTLWSRGAAEPSFLVFCYIFQSFPYPSFWVIACYYTFAFFFLYKTFDYYDCHKLGLVMFFVSGLMFWYWDMIRQCVAISIFFYATTYIREGKIWKYLLMVIFGMFFHLSMLFTLPLYSFRYLKIPGWVYSLVVVCALFLLFVGFSFNNLTDIIEKLPFYEGYSDDERVEQTIESYGYKIRMAFHGVVSLFVILNMPKNKDYLKGLLTLGTVFFMLAMGNLIIQRISIYPYYIIIFSFPLAVKNMRKALISLSCVFVFVFFLLSSKNIIDKSDRGCSPYKTVFSDDFKNGKFKFRDY